MSGARGAWRLGPGALLWGAAGVLASAALAPLEPNLLEEGFALHVAQRIASGEHMYRDIVFFSGPAPFEALAILFRVLGDSVFVGRGAVALLHGLVAAAVFDIGRRGAGTWAHPAAAALVATPALLFPLYSIYFHTTVAVELGILATWAAVRAVERPPLAATAGLLVASVALSKQSLGAVLALSLPAALLASWPRRPRGGGLVAFGAGGSAVAVLTLVLFGAVGDLAAMLRSVVVLPFTLGESFRSPFVNLWPPGRFTGAVAANGVFYVPKLYHLLAPFMAWPGRGVVLATQLLFALPWVALAWTLGRALRGALPPVLRVTGAGLVGLLANLFPRADWGHLAAVLPLGTVQLLLLWGSARQGTARGPLGYRVAGAAAGLLVLAGLVASAALWDRSREPILGPRVPLRQVGGEAGMVAPAVRYLLHHTEPGDAIFVARAEPLLYYATGTRNPTPYEGVVPGFREEQEEAILAGLPEARYVVVSDIDQPFMTFYADELPRVHAYLERHYRIPADYEGVLSPVVVLERGPDRGPAAVDLGPLWEGGGFYVTSESGEERTPSRELPRLVNRLNRRPFAIIVGPGGGGVELRVTLPENAAFEADVGLRGVMSSLGLLQHPRPVEMRVLVAEPGRSFELAGRTSVGVTGGRRWKPFAVDLARWGGREVILRLESVPRRRLEEEAVVWWGSPRIVEKRGPAPLRPPQRG